MQLGLGTSGTACRRLDVLWPQLSTSAQRNCIVHAGRERGRDGHIRIKGQGPGVSSSAWLLPTSLVSERRAKDADTPVSNPDAPLTVYTIRLTTGTSRGAALSDPFAAVNICLIGAGGVGALARISPVNDPLESVAHSREMCELIGPDVGADCSGIWVDSGKRPQPQAPPNTAASGPRTTEAAGGGGGGQPSPPNGMSQQQQQQRQGNSGVSGSGGGGNGGAGRGAGLSYGYSSGTSMVGRPPPPPPPKRRFQEGSVDEVSLLLPELGPLSGVLVGVEGGSWYLDELDVVSSRTQHLDRFICRRTLGGIPGEGAALLSPVPPGSVVYGEGEAAVLLTQDQASALRALSLSGYSDVKRRITSTTILLVACGACMAGLIGGSAAALPYVAGGVVGVVYQWLLMRGVDHVVEAAGGRSHNEQQLGGQQAGAGAEQQSLQVTDWEGEGAAAAASEAAEEGAGGGAGSGLLGSAPVRLGFVCASAALGLALLTQEESGLAPDAGAVNYATSPAAAWQLALGALGFLTYKAAMVGVSLGDGAGAGPGGLGGLGLGPGVRATARQTELEKFKRD